MVNPTQPLGCLFVGMVKVVMPDSEQRHLGSSLGRRDALGLIFEASFGLAVFVHRLTKSAASETMAMTVKTHDAKK